MSRIAKPKSFSVTKYDGIVFLIIVIYRLFLDFIYVNYVHAQFAYYHFDLDYNIKYIILSFFILFCVIWSVSRLFRDGQLTDIIIGLLILMYFIPYTSLFAYSRHDVGFALFVLCYFLLLISFNKLIKINKVNLIGAQTSFGDTKFFIILIIALGLLRIAASGVYTGFRITFDFSDYYEYRAEAREYAMPEIIRYLLGWSTTGLTVGLVYSIIKKKRLLSIYVILCTVLAFSFNGKKSIMFILFLSIAIALFYKEKYLSKIPIMFATLGGIGVVGLILFGKNSFVCKHFIRRMLFIPPNMSILHYDFFSSNEFDYLRSSVLRRFGFHSPYASYGSIPRLIGAKYFSSLSLAMNANTGLCGDAFANFGYWSILFAPLVIVLTFKILERCSKNTDRRVQVMVAVSVAYAFTNGSFFTLLLTNGILFLMVILIFLNSGKATVGNTSFEKPKLKRTIVD